MTPIEQLVGHVILREGGVADVGDGKGVTRYGQTPAWLAQFGLQPPQNAAEAASNYLAWIGLTGLTSIVEPGDSLADIVLDIAVMSDHRKAIKALQACLGVTVDGVLGPQTVDALDRADRKRLAREVVAWDIEFQGSLITLDPTRARWAKGWARRLAGHVRRLD